jgi:hypothetical protein
MVILDENLSRTLDISNRQPVSHFGNNICEHVVSIELNNVKRNYENSID